MSTDKIIFTALFSVLVAMDIAGNTLVILVVHKYPVMKTPMNYLLLNLAVSDIMVGAFFTFKSIFVHLFTHPTGTSGDVLCKILTYGNIAWVASFVSAFLLMCVALERFYAVVRPANIRKRITKNKIKYIVATCWIVATVQTIPSVISNTYDDTVQLCQELYTEQWQLATYWSLMLFIAGVVPVSLMAVLYARVIHSLWLQNENSDARRLAVKNARKRITVKSITVSAFYAVCVFPTHIFYVVSVFLPSVFEYGDVSFNISYGLLVLNSSVNPIIYTLQCGKFRACIKRLLGFSSVLPQVPR